MKKMKIFKITFCAIMAAMATIFNFIEITLPFGFNLTLYGLPLVFVSFTYGPALGLLTGFVCGAIEQIVKGISLQTFLWIIAPLAWGLLSGLVYHGLKKLFNDNKVYKKIIYYTLGILVSITVANLANSAALAVFGHTSDPVSSFGLFMAYAFARMISIPFHVVLYVPLCYILCERMKKIG